jgi:hypothetical protein
MFVIRNALPVRSLFAGNGAELGIGTSRFEGLTALTANSRDAACLSPALACSCGLRLVRAIFTAKRATV